MAVDLGVFQRLKTKQDYDREAEEFQIRKLQAMNAATGQDPASVKLANEIQKARASGDTQRLNDLVMSAKILDRGVMMDPTGNPYALGGYGDAVGSIEGAKAGYKQDAQNQSDFSWKPRTAQAVAQNEADVKLDMQPKIDAATKSATMQAENLTNAQSNLPKVEDQAKAMQALINEIEQSPGLEAVVGLPNPMKGRVPFIGNVAGSPAADFQAKLDQLGGKQFLEAFESLKGGGQITEVEGQKATNAIGRMQTSQSEGEFRKALNELRTVVNTGLDRARTKAGSGQTVRIINPQSGEILDIPAEDLPAAQAEGFKKL